MNGPDCPVHAGVSMYLLSTWNQWCYHCPKCDKRYNEKLVAQEAGVEAQLAARARDEVRRGQDS